MLQKNSDKLKKRSVLLRKRKLNSLRLQLRNLGLSQKGSVKLRKRSVLKQLLPNVKLQKSSVKLKKRSVSNSGKLRLEAPHSPPIVALSLLRIRPLQILWPKLIPLFQTGWPKSIQVISFERTSLALAPASPEIITVSALFFFTFISIITINPSGSIISKNYI